ncbi:hypothetical protein LTR09_001479 [Extremus antarcticus]|uniref:C2H2-type domain-containing protein n=1 Tax=Extremus antarcticus TaxID=702011 RepID=A0AAJ0GGT2_9PEZI|nr:hypothetical protein LTR09_001479 [Extremus antarcticus]
MAKRVREASPASRSYDSIDVHDRQHSAEPAAHTPKYAFLDSPEPEQTTMRCLLPPHKPLVFKTYEECTECKANLPTSHFLELHIAENHDPIVASKRDTGDRTYACFIEDCDKVCSEWQKRRSHLVDKHGFPKNYDFLVVNHGIDRSRSLLRAGVDEDGHRKSSRERARSDSSVEEDAGATSSSGALANSSSPKSSSLRQANSSGVPSAAKTELSNDTMDVEAAAVDSGEKGRGATGTKPNVDELASSLSSLKMVPRSVAFGRKGRSGLARS